MCTPPGALSLGVPDQKLTQSALRSEAMSTQRFEEVEPDRALLGRGADERRLVFAAQVEDEARAGLDYAAHPVAGQLPGQSRDAHRQFGRARVEVVDVECECHAAITEIGEDLDGVLEPVVGEAVGVVAEEHAGSLVCRDPESSEGSA